jgi:hypothetical protein
MKLFRYTTRFSPYCNKSLRQHHYFGCNRGVLLHRNGDLVAICVSIATQNLSCIIYLFGCNMLTLMRPFLGFPLHLVGTNATPILCCISISYVATKIVKEMSKFIFRKILNNQVISQHRFYDKNINSFTRYMKMQVFNLISKIKINQ